LALAADLRNCAGKLAISWQRVPELGRKGTLRMFSQVEEELESFLYNLWEEIFHVGFHIFKRKILNSTASFQILH
jgi:hypothetical protein